MLKDQRRQKIIEIVNSKEFVKNIELSELTNSTIQTIIADINELDNENLLIKVYGGAKSINIKPKNMQERFDEEKEKINSDAKDKIAKKASELIEDGDLIFIDTGTTTKQMIKYLYGKNITVVTNGYSIAMELIERDIDVCLVGGEIIKSTHAIVGELALKFIDGFYFNKAFIGMNNLHKECFYTTNTKESIIKERVINNSEESYVLLDSSKFNYKNKIKVDFIKQPILISEVEPDYYNKKFIIA